jgi:regulator of sigma E protease
MVHNLSYLFGSIGAFLIILTLVVTIHELGHFLVAKMFKVSIDRFAIGFGKAIFSRTDKSGVEWRIGWLPIGGYVRFSGDADASSSVPDAEDLDDLRRQIETKLGAQAVSKYFHFKPVWQRMLVVAAGPVANFVLSTVLFAILVTISGVTTLTPQVGKVTENSPAAQAGLRSGDIITALDDHKINDFKQVISYVQLRAGTAITLSYTRDGQPHAVVVTPTHWDETDQLTHRTAKVGKLGIVPNVVDANIHHQQVGLVQAVQFGLEQTWDIVATTVTYISRIVTGKESASQLSSFLGMAQTAGAVAKAGADSAPDLLGKTVGISFNLLSFAAVVSTAVGFMNLLPVPVLDGGHLVFYAYEAIARRPVGARIQAAGFRIGLALLLGLMLFATWNDIQQRAVFKLLGLFS